MSKTKLKPCPFCGGNDHYLYPEDCDRAVWWVCRGCGIEGPIGTTRLEATKRWNKRDGQSLNDQLWCLIEIRKLIGDPEAKLMQSEVVECVRELADHFRETTKKAKRCGAEKGEK